METTFYYVHSDVDDNNVARTFEHLNSAIEYAKECEFCWIVEVTIDDLGDVIYEEIVWTYLDDGEEDKRDD